MPPRLSKRQQRQAEEEALAAKVVELDRDEPELVLPTSSTKSVFDKLQEDAAPLKMEDDDDEPTNAAASKPSSTAATSTTPSKKPSKKKKGKRANKEAGAKDDVDEIDAALAELDAKLGPAERAQQERASAKQKSQLDERWKRLCDVLAFQTKNLDPDAELHRFFGRQVLNSSSPAQGSRTSPYHPRIANNPHNLAARNRKSSLVKAGAGWPLLDGALEIEAYDALESAQEPAANWFKFVHSRKYKAAQLLFLEVLQQADGNRLFEVLRMTPYHIDTLLQLGEMSAHQGDQGAAADFLDRAIYAMSSLLPSTLTNGSTRLAYSQIENRALFLAIARKVSILVKRGTYRTALEWAKVGLSLGGQEDPVGMLLWIDFLAAKCEDAEWFLSLLDSFEEMYPATHLDAYPGLAFSRALALQQLEEKNQKKETWPSSDEALKSATLKFPSVVSLLATSTGASIPVEFAKEPRSQIDPGANASYPLGILSQLYVERSGPLWKEPLRTAWLSRVSKEAGPLLGDRSNVDVRRGHDIFDKGPFTPDLVPEGIERAAFLTDLPSLRPFLRPSLLASTSYSFNPLPPSAPHATSYDDAYFDSIIHRTGARSTPNIGGYDWEGNDDDDLDAVQAAFMNMLQDGQQDPDGQVPDSMLRRLTRMLFGGREAEADDIDTDEQQ